MKALTKASKMAALKTLNLALVVLIVLPAAASVSARKPVDPKGQFAKLSGQISQAGSPSVYGNGFIVGAEGCHVLTNFHVAFGKSADPKTGEIEMVDNVDVGHTVNFAFDLDAKSGKFKRTLKAKVVEFGNYEFGTSRGFLGDIALLRLETCLGKEYGQLEIDRPPEGKTLPVGKLTTVSSSLSSEGKNEILIEEGCRADTGTTVTGMMLSYCESVPGMSGSMILEEGQDKKLRLAGVATGGGARVNGKQIAKAIYATVINKFLDSALGEAKMGPLAEQRKPQSDEQTASANTSARTVVR